MALIDRMSAGVESLERKGSFGSLTSPATSSGAGVRRSNSSSRIVTGNKEDPLGYRWKAQSSSGASDPTTKASSIKAAMSGAAGGARQEASSLARGLGGGSQQGEVLLGKLSDSLNGSKPTTGLGGLGFLPPSMRSKPLMEAASAGDVSALRKLLEGGSLGGRSELESRDSQGRSPLMQASACGSRAAVEYILSKRADANAVDNAKKTALHHTAEPRRSRVSTLRSGVGGAAAPEATADPAAVIRLLTNNRASTEARDHNGCTALMLAVASGDQAIARNLIEARASAQAEDSEGQRILDYAAMALGGENKELVDLLKTTIAEEEERRKQAIAEAKRERKERLGERRVSFREAEEPGASASSAAAAPSEAPAEAQPEVDEEAKARELAAKESERKKAEEEEKAKEDERRRKEEKKRRKEEEERAKEEERRRKEEEESEKARELERAREQAKEEALAKVNELMLSSSATAPDLEAAIKAALAVDVEEEKLLEADKRRKELKSAAKAQEKLRSAIADMDIGKLRKAIAKAEEAGVSADAMAEAKAILAREEPKLAAREQLQAAQASGDADQLKAAMSQAKQVGIDDAELEAFQEALARAEERAKAEAALVRAIESKDIDELKAAIKEAKGLGVESDSLKKAKSVLKKEEPKVMARKLLAQACESPTIEALKEAMAAAEAAGLEAAECSQAASLLAEAEAKQKARDALASACEARSIDGLKEAIQAAEQAGLDEADIGEAREALRQEEEKAAKLAALKATMEECSTVDFADIDALRDAKEKLGTALQEAAAAGVEEVHLLDAEQRRKKIHNAIEDLKGSIRVFCRIRPLSTKEAESGDKDVTRASSCMTLEVQGRDDGAPIPYNFDSVFTPGTQDEVFEDCRDLVQSAVDGYNVTIFAYGQTGAGKTFTMYGAPGLEGTTPRTIREIYRLIEQGSSRFDYTVTASMLELYQNGLVDLLSKGQAGVSKKLNIRQEKSGAVLVEALSEEECPTAESLHDLLERGNVQRTVASTAMNSESSRSHLVFMIRITSINKETKETLRGKILLCDLAGSERIKKSLVTAEAQKEAIEINKSLTALGDVIEALTKGNKQVPYRNHKLTQLMQDALGGTAKTLMFVNCSPADSNLDETINSLKYATRAKCITNNVVKKAEASTAA